MSSDVIKNPVPQAELNDDNKHATITVTDSQICDTDNDNNAHINTTHSAIQEYDDDAQDHERPSKRRRISESASSTPKSVPKPKPISPPWKKVAAEGPTSFTQDGRRKSGRVNTIPIELDTLPAKRQTRGTYKVLNSTPVAKDQKTLPQRKLSDSVKKAPSSIKSEISKSIAKHVATTKHPTNTPQPPHFKQNVPEKRSHKKGEGKKAMQERSRKSTGNKSEARPSQNHEDTNGNSESSVPKIRIRFKVNVHPPLSALPILHPEHIPKPMRHFKTIEQFFEEGSRVPLELGGLYSADDDPAVTREQAEVEARLLRQLEGAAEGDGLLSRELSYALYSESSEIAENRRALRQYAHQDHFIRAAIEFRVLMSEEVKRHKRNAKRMADACKEEWLRRQPKSDEELALEAFKAGELRYRSVIKSLQGTWDNVKIEINNRRVKEWQLQEQIRVRRELDEAVDISAMKLEARRARSVTDVSDVVDDPDDRDSNSSDSESDSQVEKVSSDDADNMSSSESDSALDNDEDEVIDVVDGVEDESLTVEELRAKYADIPAVELISTSDNDDVYENGLAVATTIEEIDEPVARLAAETHDDDNDDNNDSIDDDSDESVDMDDDMGESDEAHSDDETQSLSESDSSEEGERGLLGFFPTQDVRSTDIQEVGTDRDRDTPDDSAFARNHNAQSNVIQLPKENGNTRDESPIQPTDVQISEPLKGRTSEVSTRTEPAEAVEHCGANMDLDVEEEIGEHSSIQTPNTCETKPSEPDSASSLELQDTNRSDSFGAAPSANAIKTPVPQLLRGTLREYQHYGLDWLAGLYATKNNGILADEMGLGKTIQTIALLAHLACVHHVWGTHLVIVPTSVILNWEIEFKKFCPGFKILSYYGTQEERRRKRMGWNTEDTWNVVITSYQVVVQDHQVFRRRKWHYMILDEAHNIKNFKSKRWQTLLAFNTQARLLLTGTPLQNNLTELWSLLFFLMPGDKSNKGFASLEEYSDWFRKPQEQILENGRETMTDESRADIAKLHTILRPYLLRRLKADVEKQMPGKFEHVEWCRLSRRQRELYDGFLSTSSTRQTLASGNYMSIIGCLMQLRKVCNHPDLFDKRPIMSSFPMKKSLIADFEIKDLIVRRRLLHEHPMNTVSLRFLNMVPTENEHLASSTTDRSAALTAQRLLIDLRESQRLRATNALFQPDPASVQSNIAYLENSSRWGRFEELQHCVYLSALRRQQKPIYGSGLIKLLSVPQRLDGKPRGRPLHREKIISWMWDDPEILQAMTPSLEKRSDDLRTIIQKFACITPRITTPDALPVILARQGLERFQTAPHRDQPDAFHEARMKLSIQFPDKRLLQYDCGKLQTLDRLLRRLQAGGHRALIFTQMTKVLDILEQFLNIHGHRYLRLDGSTKIEHRQVLTDRFNNDTRILAFILSSRSGGMGINLTGADTVIFYDMDWNPAMDKQCQDRAHRIGQTRDVHIYRLVSEHTIEANILRKANQKRMLDDVVIQEGEFTTDQFKSREASKGLVSLDEPLSDTAAAANAAMDRVLGGAATGDSFAQAEDQEDVAAAKIAQQEVVQADADDFEERTGARNNDVIDSVANGTIPLTGENDQQSIADPEDHLNMEGQPIKSIDEYMLYLMAEQMRGTPIQLPKDKRRDRHGKRDRAHRAR